jgi:hypothetical protein
MGKGPGKNTIKDTRALNSFLPLQTAASSSTGTPILDPDTSESRQSSSDASSDIAQEIVVWTADMDLDSENPGDSDDLSLEYVISIYGPILGGDMILTH